MDIVIIADFCGNLLKPGNSRFLYLAELLSKGNNVEIITSDFDHGTKKYFRLPGNPCGYQITLLHEGSYPKNVCLQRFRAHHIWGMNVKKYLNQRKKPDVIYCAIPPITAAVQAAQYCKQQGIRFIVDVQDLWPEAFQMVVHVPMLSDLIFAPMRAKIDLAYRQADEIVAVSQSYCNRAMEVNEKVKAAYPVFLGTKLEVFDQNAAENAPRFKKPEGELWLGYCGTLGHSYDLHCVIDALAILKEKAPRFLVMGSGPKAEEFARYAREKRVDALFTGNLPYPEMCSQLKECDMVVNPIVGTSVASIINKHADYAAAGLPILNTQESPEYRRLVDAYQMGFNCKNGSAEDLAEKLQRLMEDRSLRCKMGANARRCAEERFDRKKTYGMLAGLITNT